MAFDNFQRSIPEHSQIHTSVFEAQLLWTTRGRIPHPLKLYTSRANGTTVRDIPLDKLSLPIASKISVPQSRKEPRQSQLRLSHGLLRLSPALEAYLSFAIFS